MDKKISNFNYNIEIYSEHCYNLDSDEEYFNDSDEFYKEYSDGKIPVKQIRIMNLFLEKTRKIG